MPTRSLNSSVLKWPDRESVDRAVRAWAARAAAHHPDLVRLGYFGSYARGDWGVGSDVDLVAVVRQATRAFHERTREWDLTELPVPADILIYTQAEWENLAHQSARMAQTLADETVWVWPGVGAQAR